MTHKGRICIPQSLRGEGGEQLKAPCSHKVTLKASLITSALCLSLSRKHDYVNIKRVRPREGQQNNESFMVPHVREKVCSGVFEYGSVRCVRNVVCLSSLLNQQGSALEIHTVLLLSDNSPFFFLGVSL